MARKLRTRANRIPTICAWSAMIVLGVAEIAVKSHGSAGFLPLLQIAVSSMALLHEIKGLIEEPE